jgi:hypothetical protein
MLFLLLNNLRAAMKMANIDSVFDEMFTDPKDSFGVNYPLF